jgi:predicted Rossmann fold flavoprotein
VSQSYDAIVLGAGAAGMFCAARAGQAGKRVLLLEGADAPGKKILISGGGRCNFTNLHSAPERFLSSNPHFAKSALSRFTPHDFLTLVETHGIAWHEKTLGQLFCDGSAKQIVAMLLAECEKGGVELRCGVALGAAEHRDGHFHIASASAPSLVIATGGPSIPKLGASGYAYDLARRFSVKVVQPRPALVPLTLSAEDALFRELSGVSTEVIAKCGKAAFREAALFTHRGLSGPAILQISSYWQSGSELAIDLLPKARPGWLLEAKRTRPRSTLRKLLGEMLPDRLAQVLTERLGQSADIGNTPDRVLSEAEARLAGWRFHPTGSEGFAKAEVTLGGIATAELSSRTMEARKVPGLYAIGEAVDVTGWLGGYNFQWAWASGAAAAEGIAS